MIKIARLIPTVLLALLLLGNSSCGYLSDQAKSDQQIVDSTSLTGCQLDPDSFTHILQRDLTKQIECLEKNFIHFTRYVKREHQDSIHQGEISRFIRKFFVNNSETILQALNLMFEFNMLFLSDHTQGVSQDNIDPLFELLLTVNREAVVISNILTKINHKNFWQNRHRFKQSINRFSQATLNIISLEGRLPTQIQIRPFLRKIKQRLSSISFDVERVESFLFVKNILLGGDREVITSTEIQTLVGNAPKILTMAFDLFYLTSQNFDSEAEYFRFMADKVDEFRTIYYKRPGNSPLFTMEEFITASDIFASDEFRLGDYRENLLLVKERMFGPPADIFLMDDLEELLSVTRLLLRSLPDNLNIVVLLRSLKNIFDESTINFKMAESALFLKQLVLGGSRELITLKEVNTLLTKSPQLLKIFNLTSQMRQAPDTRKKMALAQQALTQLQPLLVPLPAEAMLTTVKSLLQFADDLTHGEYQLMEKLEELKTLKVTFLGGERESISVSDFHNAINVTKYLVTTLPDGMNLSQLISDYPTLVINRSIDLEFLEMLNTYKRVLAGGESGVITVDEIKLLLEHRKPLERLTNRLANRPPLSIDDRKSFIYFLKVIEDLTPLIFDGPKEQVATTISDVVATINGDSSTPDIINDELKESIHQLKKSLLGGDRDQLTFQEVKDLLYITEIFLRDIQQELSIIPFLARVDTISRLSLRPERWKPLLFIKSLFLGGKKESISFQELPMLLDKGVELYDIYRDIYGTPTILKLDEIGQKMGRYLLHLDTILSLFYQTDGELQLLTANELTLAAEVILDPAGAARIKAIIPTINALKIRLIGGESENYTLDNIKQIVAMVKEGAELLYFNDITFEHFRERMEDPTPITSSELGLDQLILDGYELITTDRLNQLKQDFATQLEENRTYRTKDGLQYLTQDNVRLKYGLQERSLLTFALQKVFRSYGHLSAGGGYYVANQEELLLFMEDMRSFLVYAEMSPISYPYFSSNTILLSDLFQINSNGDGLIDKVEESEYISLILTAVTVGDQLIPIMKKRCANLSTDSVSFEISCYRQHLFDILFNKLDMAPYFSKLYRFTLTESPSDLMDFIINVERFAKEQPGEEVPLSKKDLYTLLGSMFNIESVFISFDHNHDNILDPIELERAFQVYRNSIIKIADLEPDSAFTKSVFLYMIKYMEIPSKTQLINFHYNPWMSKKVYAKRLNIAALLRYLVTDEKRKRAKKSELSELEDQTTGLETP